MVELYIDYNVRTKILLHLVGLFITTTRDDLMTFLNILTVSGLIK